MRFTSCGRAQALHPPLEASLYQKKKMGKNRKAAMRSFALHRMSFRSQIGAARGGWEELAAAWGVQDAMKKKNLLDVVFI